jgi:hypothetical protein
MRDIAISLFSAEELKEANPRSFQKAYDKYANDVLLDPHWSYEYRESLKSIQSRLIELDSKNSKVEGVKRCMAWLENNILSLYRIKPHPLSLKNFERRKFAMYGPAYRPGQLKPCPFTGFCVDDSILQYLKDLAKDGEPVKNWQHLVDSFVEQLWENEIESQASEENFLEEAKDLNYEFYEDGRLYVE